jgi:hypothetical protein
MVSFVLNGYFKFFLKRLPSLTQFYPKASLIHTFKQTRINMLVNFNRRPADLIGQLIKFFSCVFS